MSSSSNKIRLSLRVKKKEFHCPGVKWKINNQEKNFRHCMLFHFRLGVNATVAQEKIIRKSQCWLRIFLSGGFSLFDGKRSRRPE